jgi:FKBP-type peptidyl-prolyl cis-trans isomerase
MPKLPKHLSALIMIVVFAAAASAQQGIVFTESGLRYQELEIGSGEPAASGKVAVIHFTAWLDDSGAKGAQYFDTREHGEPVAFKLGTDNVMPGWNIGVEGMRVGGKRLLMIPAKLGYGAKGVGELVPPHADLIFEVELVDIR